MHTFIRIPAGAMLAAGAVGDVSAAIELSAALLGGTLVVGSYVTKAGGRLLINTSLEPVTNWGASISEDLLVIAGLWTALHHPVLFLIMLVAFVALMIWLLPRLWRLLKAIFTKVGRWLGLTSQPEDSEAELTANSPAERPVKKIEHDPH
jgi:CBS domain containing-hemolysin-like protein